MAKANKKAKTETKKKSKVVDIKSTKSGVRLRNQIFLKENAEKTLNMKCKRYDVVYESGALEGTPRRAKLIGDVMEYLAKRDREERKEGVETTFFDKILQKVYKDGLPK
jgi:hypothetical protein